MTRPHWSQRYVGLPWQQGGQGPDAFDCWGLLLDVQRRAYMRKLPDYDLEQLHEAGTLREFMSVWVQVDKPIDGCGVRMGKDRRIHVGVYLEIDGGKVLHAAEGYGVILSSLTQIKTMGFSPIEFYHYRGRRAGSRRAS